MVRVMTLSACSLCLSPTPWIDVSIPTTVGGIRKCQVCGAHELKIWDTNYNKDRKAEVYRRWLDMKVVIR